jgi:hypothetical protein
MTDKSTKNHFKLCILQSVFYILFLGSLPLHAQLTRTSSNNANNQYISPPVKCLTDQLLQQKIATNPSYANRLQLMNQKILNAQNSASRSIQTIPVVVHVIHLNGAENITDQQIFDGIQHLNDAFANAGAYFDPNGTDVNIRFCLAQQDPNGFFTNGINRGYSELTNVTVETQDSTLKNLIRWDPNKYLNIWLVKEITSISMGAGIAGYAYFPTSQGQAEDGIVNEAELFGSSVNNSKVHIHEAGHYLGLYHTFEGACTNSNCQTDGDHVCDTPPDQSTAVVNCTDAPNTCTSDANDQSTNNPFRAVALGGIGDQPDQFQNYMDYGFQACQKYFTAGQAARMQAALNEERAILLQSIACQSLCFYPIGSSITSSSQQITAGDNVTFTATFVSNPISLPNFVEWKINNQIVGNQYELTYLFPTAGTYTIELTAYNDSPNCLETKTLIIQVECPSQANFNFTTTTEFNPGDQITAVNLSSNNLTNQWILDGQPSSTNAIWAQTFLTAGSHALYLITGNGTCFDTSATKFFQIGNCNYSKVTDNWVFANGGMRFIEGGILQTASPIFDVFNECTSSISDADGNLLFVSDGSKIWDANYIIMPNGDSLLGCQSSSQAVLITPNPGNPNQFYVFTNDCSENVLANGMRYSLVDMTLNGGLGDVVPNYKNIKILDLGSEKLSATWHANGRDIWVGAQENGTNKWYAFLIDNNGINIQPVISNIGTASQSELGGMRFSNDGNRMAACMISGWPWRILLSDFNKQTGEYSNPIELLLSTEITQQPFNVVFSPDNSKLYVSLWQGSDLLQYDLTYTTANAIQNSRYAVDPYNLATFGTLVLASNGKIYVNPNAGGGIDEIREPNLAGAACQYYSRPSGEFPTFQSGSSFPNMLQGYLNPSNPVIAGPQNICKGGGTYTYGIALSSAEDSTIWQHTGQGVFSAQNGQNSCTLTSGDDIGTDTIFATVYGRCGITRDTIHIQTNEQETTNLPEQIFGCDSLWLNPGNDFIYYLWQDGSTQNPYFVDTAGVYIVTLKGHSGCIFTDTTIYSPYPSATNLSLGPDANICGDQVVVLQTTQNYQSYTWQDGSHNSTYTAFNPGTYWVTVPSGCENSVTDSIQVTASLPISLNLNLNGVSTVCKTALPFTLNAPAGFTSYLWSTGATTQNLPLTSIGTYSLLAIDANGCESRDTFYVIDCILGINETDTKNSFSIFPNPANEEVQISFSNPESGTIQVFNNLGQLCFSQEIKSTKQEKLNISNWSQGMYLVRFISQNSFTSQGFVKH